MKDDEKVEFSLQYHSSPAFKFRDILPSLSPIRMETHHPSVRGTMASTSIFLSRATREEKVEIDDAPRKIYLSKDSTDKLQSKSIHSDHQRLIRDYFDHSKRTRTKLNETNVR